MWLYSCNFLTFVCTVHTYFCMAIIYYPKMTQLNKSQTTKFWYQIDRNPSKFNVLGYNFWYFALNFRNFRLFDHSKSIPYTWQCKKCAQWSISTQKWRKLTSVESYDFRIKLMRKVWILWFWVIKVMILVTIKYRGKNMHKFSSFWVEKVATNVWLGVN